MTSLLLGGEAVEAHLENIYKGIIKVEASKKNNTQVPSPQHQSCLCLVKRLDR